MLNLQFLSEADCIPSDLPVCWDQRSFKLLIENRESTVKKLIPVICINIFIYSYLKLYIFQRVH